MATTSKTPLQAVRATPCICFAGNRRALFIRARGMESRSKRLNVAEHLNPMQQRATVPGSTRMTTELTQPQPEMGPAPDNGQVPSQGHRRRRRRRKNKSSQQNAPQAQQPQIQQPPQQQPQMQAPPPPQQKQPQQHQNQPRKKKKVLPERVGPSPPSPATASPARRRASAKASREARASLSVPWTTATAPSTAT